MSTRPLLLLGEVMYRLFGVATSRQAGGKTSKGRRDCIVATAFVYSFSLLWSRATNI